EAAGADIADHLTAADQLARKSGNAAHVTVARLDAVRMGDRDLPAVTAVPARGDHAPIRRGDDRGPGRRAEVDAGVEADVAEDRVEALAEARGHAARDRQAHRRVRVAADAVGIDPDDLLAVGPFQKLDIGACDAVE